MTGVPPYKREVNTVFQSYALFPHLTSSRTSRSDCGGRRCRKPQLQGRTREILRIVGLEGFDERKPSQLSGGQQQRVALARALVNSPKVLLLDEPLGALDLKLRKQMQLELKRIQSELGLTFVHVTHDQEEAMTMADAIAVMNHGKIEQLGSPTDLYERPRTASSPGSSASRTCSTAPSRQQAPCVSTEWASCASAPSSHSRHARADRGSAGAAPARRDRRERAQRHDRRARVHRRRDAVHRRHLRWKAHRLRQSSGTAVEGDNVTVSWDPDSTFVVEEAT